jgi:hypothetical protein
MSRSPRTLRSSVAVALALLLAGACATQPAASDGGADTPLANASTPPVGTQEADRAAINRLVADAKAIARVTGCGSAEQCASVGVGVRACGGPSEYIVYCPTSTDTAALRRKVEDVARAERAFNAKYNMASTCEFRMAPGLELAGGSCRAVDPNRVP